VGRSRRSAKNAGTAFELSIANYLSFEVDDRIERRVKHGANDRGDIGGLRVHNNKRVVIECKDYRGEIHAGTWIKEAHAEMGNDDAIAGVVVAKRKGTTAPGEQWVLMTVDDLIALVMGERPDA
jgi:hypothetical protein